MGLRSLPLLSRFLLKRTHWPATIFIGTPLLVYVMVAQRGPWLLLGSMHVADGLFLATLLALSSHVPNIRNGLGPQLVIAAKPGPLPCGGPFFGPSRPPPLALHLVV